jgi:uncharacterized membrane protein YccC
MDDRHPNDPIYSAIVIGALVGFVALGVLGLPTPLLALVAVAVGALLVFALAARDAPRRDRRSTRRVASGTPHYAPSVLQPGTGRARRRRFGPRRRGTRPSGSLPHL